MIRTIGFSLAGMILALSSWARPITSEEDVAITRAIHMFVKGMNDGDAQAVADATIIPRVLAVQASQLGVEPAALYKNFLDNLGEFLQSIEIHDVEFDQTDLDIQEVDNTKWTWMEYNFIIDVDGDELAVKSRTLAIEDNSNWYLVRVDEQNLPVLMSLFPEIGFENYGEAVITRATPE